MTEIRENLRFGSTDLEEMNRVMGRIQDRLDALEGLRGEPAFFADIDMQQKYLKNVAGMSQDIASEKTIFTQPVSFTQPINLIIINRDTPFPGLNDLPNSGDMAIWNYANTVRLVVNLNGTFWQAFLAQYFP
jgi:hypothetical protein